MISGNPVSSETSRTGTPAEESSVAVPPVETIFVEEPQPEGPYGAKGVGEIGLVPTAGAVAGALHAFDGGYRTRLPMRESAAARAAVPRLAHRR